MVIIIIFQKSSSEILNEEDVAVSNVRIDLSRGRHNPLERFVKMGYLIQFLHLHIISLSLSSILIIILSLSIFIFLFVLVGLVASASIHFFKVQTMPSIRLSIKIYSITFLVCVSSFLPSLLII